LNQVQIELLLKSLFLNFCKMYPDETTQRNCV